jgi:hypothetical protein
MSGLTLLTKYRPDLMVLGFQEIVPLTAQQIVQADPEKRYNRAYSSLFDVNLSAHLFPLPSPTAGEYGNVLSLIPLIEGPKRKRTTCYCEVNRYAAHPSVS